MKPILLCLLLGIQSPPALGVAPVLHPKATALPFKHQGPFMNTADGAVVCMDAKNALLSKDEGLTWAGVPLFAVPEKFTVRIERALLRTREGVVISAWPNDVVRRMPQPFAWGAAGQSLTDWFLPTYVCRSLDDGKTWEPPLVDVRAAYETFAAEKKTTVDAMLPDGMHPGDLGHELVARLLAPVVEGDVQ